MECTRHTLLQFVQHQVKNAARRFVVGFVINSGFTFLQQLLRHLRKPSKTFSIRRLLIRFIYNKHSISLGAFMACYGFVFQCVRRLLAQSSSPLVQAVVAGAAAGVSIHTLSKEGTFLDVTDLSLHALVRSVEAAVRQTSLLPAGTHADSAIFIISCTVIMYCWFFHPQTLSAEYRSWIFKMAQMDPFLLELLRQLKDGTIKYGVHTHALDDYCDRNGIAREKGDVGNGFVSCAVVHPLDGSSCAGNAVRRAARGFVAASSLYVPVHLIAQILVHRRDIFKAITSDDQTTRGKAVLDRAKYILRSVVRALTAAARSSAFLGTFIGLVWSGVCIARQTRQDDLPTGPLLGSFMSGWSIFIEAPHRRAELAAYVAPRALHTTWRRMEQKGWVSSVPGAHVSVFALASAIMLGAYEYSKRSSNSLESDRPSRSPAPSILNRLEDGQSVSESLEPQQAEKEADQVATAKRDTRGSDKQFSPTLKAIIELMIS